MSAIHMRQIKAYLTTTFQGKIDLADYNDRSEAERENAFLTRALAAFAIMTLADTDPSTATQSVTDGYGDNGVDAVHYDSKERILYVVQSKWDHDDSGSLERGEAQKFIKGLRDLVAPRFDRFNAKVKRMLSQINNAISDARTHIFLVAVYTGQQPLAPEVKRDFDDLLKEMNDPTEVVTLKTLRQLNLYNTISRGAAGAPIDLDIALYEWGQTREPHQAFYGQVSASDVAGWWNEHYPKIFAPNIRVFLGDTDVNQGILTTIRSTPESFWYFNNGITALCASITKKALGGSSREMGVFECKDLRVVNGAQTVGSVAAAHKSSRSGREGRGYPSDSFLWKTVPKALIGKSREPTTRRIALNDGISSLWIPNKSGCAMSLRWKACLTCTSGEAVTSGSVGFDLSDATVAVLARNRYCPDHPGQTRDWSPLGGYSEATL